MQAMLMCWGWWTRKAPTIIWPVLCIVRLKGKIKFCADTQFLCSLVSCFKQHLASSKHVNLSSATESSPCLFFFTLRVLAAHLEHTPYLSQHLAAEETVQTCISAMVASWHGRQPSITVARTALLWSWHSRTNVPVSEGWGAAEGLGQEWLRQTQTGFNLSGSSKGF